MPKRLLASVVLLAWLAAAPCAAAQPGDARSVARALFDEGRALLEQEKFAEAASKFEESYRLDPGGGTLLNLALCHERAGRTATAWVEFHEARRVAQLDARDDRVAYADTHLAALEARLTRLRVVVPADARVPGLRVEENGVPVGEAAWGEALPVDPGKHRVAVSAPGKRTQELEVDAEAGIAELTVPRLEDEAPPPPAAAPLVREPLAPARKTAAIGAAAAGALAIGVGAYFGLRALAKERDAEGACRTPPTGCDLTTAGPLTDQARTAADVSTVLFVVGGVSLAASLVLLLWPASSPPVRASLPAAYAW